MKIERNVFFPYKFFGRRDRFIEGLDPKAVKELLYNIRLAEQANDPRLFKKLRDEIWEFRVRYGTNQIRPLAFWDKSDNRDTLVFATHGFIKKVDKVPNNEIERAKNIRKRYFDINK